KHEIGITIQFTGKGLRECIIVNCAYFRYTLCDNLHMKRKNCGFLKINIYLDIEKPVRPEYLL
ncbi:unnamed protein product, partial [Callosobruchus maculatus]